MMETARIRKAGYAIRHTYKDFATRYRVLVKGVTTTTDPRTSAVKICTEVLGTKGDYALGKTKIFLKEHHDRLLERTRSEIYARAIDVIQRGMRRIIFRKFMQRYRNAALVIQKNWRARKPRIHFLTMQNGFSRLQALIHTRDVSIKYQILRRNLINLQARCRGFLMRRNLSIKISEKSQKIAELAQIRIQEEQELKSAGHPAWKQEAEKRYFARLAVLNKDSKIEQKKEIHHQNSIEEQYKVIDELFDFLPEWQTPKMKPKAATRKVQTPTFRVSRMISYLEAKSRDIRHIPSKLLSRPNYYHDNTSTRL